MAGVFPAFIRAEYDPSSKGFPDFERAAQASVERSRQLFEQNFAEIGRVVQRSVGSGLKANGAIDLGVDQFRQAAAEAAAYNESLKLTLTTARDLAHRTGDTSASTQNYINALSAQVQESNRARAAADQQVATYTRLQGALDATSQHQRGLAESYRALYAEQARAARGEVYARNYQAGITEAFSPGLTQQAKSASQSAQVFEEAARQAERYAQQAQILRASLDPMYMAQQRFDQEMVRADTLLAAGAISTREYAQAQQLARQTLQAHAQAVMGDSTALNKLASQARLGTTALGAVTNSARASRFATLQLGQQMQDAVIQWQMGTSALTILAQQGSQAAFALSGLETRVGRVAKFIAGPWGTAIFAGVAVIGYLTSALRDNSEAAKAAEKASQDFARSQLDIATFFDTATGKIREQNAELRENAILKRAEQVSEIGKQSADKVRDAVDAARALRMRSVAAPGAAVGGVGGVSFEVDPDVARLLDEAGDDIHKLNTAIRELAKTRPDLKPLRNQINEAAAAATHGAKEIARLQAEGLSIANGTLAQSLYKKSGAAGGSPTALLNAQARYNAADDPTEKVRARLAVVKAENGELLRQGKISRDLYLSRVQSAEEEVQAAERIKATGAALSKAQKEAQRLADFGDRAAEKIAKISAQFDDQPRDIDRARLATRQLDDLIKDLSEREPPGFEKMIADAEKAKTLIPEALGKPYRDMLEQQERQIDIQAALNAGREDEADQLQLIYRLMDMTGTESLDQLATALALRGVHAEDFEQMVRNLGIMRQQSRELEVQRVRQQIYLNALYDVERSIQQSLAGLRTKGIDSIKGLISNIGRVADNLIADYVVEKVFGSTFRALRDQIEGKSPLRQANERLASDVGETSDQFDRLGEAAARVAAALDAAGGRISGRIGAAANDNIPPGTEGVVSDGGTITVTARRNATGQAMQDPLDFLAKTFAGIAQKGLDLSDESTKKLAESLGDAFKGAMIGQVAGGLILGSSGDRTGEAIGGALGNIAGKAIGKSVGGLLGKLGGPIGSAVGGVLGGLVGGLFGSKKEASSTLIINNGEAYGATPIGKGSKELSAAQSLTDNLGSALSRIAEQLGGTLGSASVSLGYRPGHKAGPYRVDPTGRGGVAGGPVVAFDDEEDAIRYAIIDALKDGAIQGVREGTKRLLRAGHDLDVALQKALSFEQVFKDLKRYEDPVGAAIDELNAKFERLKTIFKEAGASAEEYADLEKLYGYERAEAIKQASSQALDALKSLLHDLTIGDSGKSLRDRIAAAKQVYDPLAADLGAGKAVDYDAFADAARDLLDVTRQYSGSQSDYFSLLDEVTRLTQQALKTGEAGDGSTLPGSPFDTTPIVNASERNAQVIVDGITNTLAPRLDAVNDNLGRILVGAGRTRADSLAYERLNY